VCAAFKYTGRYFLPLISITGTKTGAFELLVFVVSCELSRTVVVAKQTEGFIGINLIFFVSFVDESKSCAIVDEASVRK
jgi:hypothetical protein